MAHTTSILIVDSNPGFARMLQESLEQDDHYQAIVAQAGPEALAIASREQFDLAIVDLGLDAANGLDGEAVARQLRQRRADVRLMLMPLEGDALSDDLDDLDVQGVLPKPFFLPDLPDLLRAAFTAPLAGSSEPARVPELPVIQPAPQPEEKAHRPRPARIGPPEPPQVYSPQVVRELEALAGETNADIVAVICGGMVLESVGRLSSSHLNILAHIVSLSCELSNRAARLVDRKQRHVELIAEGDEHMLYALTVVEDILLAAVLGPDVRLGLLRHRAKATARRLRDLMTRHRHA